MAWKASFKSQKHIDNKITGGNSVEEVQVSKQEIGSLLNEAKFELKKWSSNSLEVLKNLEEKGIEPLKSIEVTLAGIINIAIL